MQNPSKCIVILSGGMDSATTLAYAVREHGRDNVIALTFDYGQRHLKEMEAAAALAGHYKVKHIVFRIFLEAIGGSALTDKAIKVPAFKADEDVWKRTHVALTYVPFRNTIFCAIAVAYAETLGCQYIYTGFNYIDSGGYPDTTPKYLDALNMLITLGSRDKPTVRAPLITMTKKAIVQLGETLGVPWQLSWSCYEGQARPCGKCNACFQRAKGFAEANVRDPLVSAITHHEEVQDNPNVVHQLTLNERCCFEMEKRGISMKKVKGKYYLQEWAEPLPFCKGCFNVGQSCGTPCVTCEKLKAWESEWEQYLIEPNRFIVYRGNISNA